METPLLKVARNDEDQTSPAIYGSTGNNQGFCTANEPNVSTGNGQDAGTRVTKANITGRKHDKCTENGHAASPAGGKDVIIAVNPNVREAHRAKLCSKCSSPGIKIAQGMLHFALLTANISQLMTALDGGYPQFWFLLLVIVISLCIILEIVVGALMIYTATLDMNNEQLHEKYDILDMAAAGVAGPVVAFNLMILVFGRQDYTYTWIFLPK